MKIYAVKQNIIPCFRGQVSASKNFCSHENDKQTEYEKMSHFVTCRKDGKNKNEKNHYTY